MRSVFLGDLLLFHADIIVCGFMLQISIKCKYSEKYAPTVRLPKLRAPTLVSDIKCICGCTVVLGSRYCLEGIKGDCVLEMQCFSLLLAPWFNSVFLCTCGVCFMRVLLVTVLITHH